MVPKKDIEQICCLNKNWKPSNINIKKVGGQTNRNYRVRYKNTFSFVRLAWERGDIVDRETEAKNILALAELKKLKLVLPKYHIYIFQGKNILNPKEQTEFDLPNGTMVMEYIKGRDIDGRDLIKPKVQAALIKTLYCFHTSGVKFVNPYDVFRDEILKYKNEAKKFPLKKLIDEETIKKIEDIEKIIKEKIDYGGEVSTHNDLIFENLRLGKNGRIYLLDFEYAGFNIREGLCYDLGIILGGNLFQKNPIDIKTYKKFIKKASMIYGRKLSSQKTYFGALTNILVMFWWGLIKYFSSELEEEKKYFKRYVLDRAKGIEFLFDFLKKKKGLEN